MRKMMLRALVVVMVLVPLMATAAQDEPITITWHGIPAISTDVDAVSAAASEYLQAKGVNVNLRLVAYTFGEYAERMPLILTTGEPCDIVFTAGWAPNNFFRFSANGAYADLTQLLPEYAPELWASLTPEMWNAGRGAPGSDAITGVPNMAGWRDGNRGMIMLSKVLDEIPFDKMEESAADGSYVITFDEWEPYLMKVREAYPDALAVLPSGEMVYPGDFGYETVLNGTGAEGVAYGDKTLTVVNVVELPQWEEAAQRARRWVEAGIMYDQNMAMNEAIANFAAGRFLGRVGYWDLGEEGLSKPDRAGLPGRGRYLSEYAATYLVPFRSTASMTSVCATSEHPEAAVQVLNLANTDPAFYNLLSWGIEGKHWVWVDKSKLLIDYPEGVDATTVTYQHQHWTLGSVFNSYYFDEALAGMQGYRVIEEGNKAATPSPLLGFVFDPAAVETQLAQCRAVWGQYRAPLNQGQVADVAAGVAELRAQLQACGVNDIIAEMQRQINAWAGL